MKATKLLRSEFGFSSMTIQVERYRTDGTITWPETDWWLKKKKTSRGVPGCSFFTACSSLSDPIMVQTLFNPISRVCITVYIKHLGCFVTSWDLYNIPCIRCWMFSQHLLHLQMVPPHLHNFWFMFCLLKYSSLPHFYFLSICWKAKTIKILDLNQIVFFFFTSSLLSC